MYLVERFDRAMADDRADAGVEMSEQPLRLAEPIGLHHARPPRARIFGPPRVDVGHHLGLRAPTVDRKAECGLSDEDIASDGFERRADAVRLELVVAGRDPDLAAVLDPRLGRAKDMACGMQRKPHVADFTDFAILQRLDAHVAKPLAQDGRAILVTEVGAAAPSRVIRVAVRDHRQGRRTPGIDVKFSGRAVESLRRGNDQILVHSL
jgi:hypothetical protein